VTIVRLIDLVAIGLSLGFTGALYWRIGGVRVSRYLSRARAIYLASYALYAAGAMTEIQFALHDGKGATWRTALVTVAAFFSLAGTLWAWLHWREIRDEMENGTLETAESGA